MSLTLKQAQKLTRMIQHYADLQENDSWTGGGDPTLVEPTRKRLDKYRTKLQVFIYTLIEKKK